MKTKNSKKQKDVAVEAVKNAQSIAKQRRSARQAVSDTIAVSADQILQNDFKNAILIVSITVNLFVLTTWLVMQVTDRYNAAMIMFMLR